MFDKLSSKAKKLLNKKNKNPLAKYFQNTEYAQDTEWRRIQVLFFKLLMIAAYADEDLDEDELNLIKDYTFENSLTEGEWREIDYFRTKKVSDDEVQKIVRDIMGEINSKKEKVDILKALKEVIESDDIVKSEEMNILNIIEEEMEKHSDGLFSKLSKSISGSLNKKKKEFYSGNDAEIYSKNPIVPILKGKLSGRDDSEIEVFSAILGLAIALIHVDMEFHEKEKAALQNMIEEECGVSGDEAKDIAEDILTIPDTYFEIAYLGRIITDSTEQQRRLEILSSLFDIAYADKVYSPHEDNYLRIISKYLMLDHSNFIALKLERKP